MEKSKIKSKTRRISIPSWSAVLSSSVAVLAAMVASVVKLMDLTARRPLVFAIFAGFVGLLIVAQVTTTYLRRGPSRLVMLKSNLRDAYLNSLDASRLNPERKGGE